MDERQLYTKLLGLKAPWTVTKVEIEDEKAIVKVWIERPRGSGDLPCSKCGRMCSVYDHRERQWRHLDTMQYETRLHASVPRVECKEHGVVQVEVPWAGPRSRFTMLFEILTIDWLSEASVVGVSRRLGLSWNETWTIQRQAVKRGLERRRVEELREVGVDEKSFARRHDYVTIVTDLVGTKVLYVADDRKEESLAGFWAMGLTQEQRQGIEVVAMDMWDPYVRATEKCLPDGKSKIVFDRYHIMAHLNKGVDRVRRAEAKELSAQGDRRLVGTKYTWLRNRANFDDASWRRFAPLRRSNLKVARAWAIKETAANLWTYSYEKAARTFFDRWYYWVTHSQLEPMIEKAKMLKRRLANILTFVKHPVTNAASEGVNSKIQWIRYQARGYRNRENFKTAIYFHCGKLDLYPLPTHTRL
jgi:transposase